ncbi:unnamed protein product [Phaedon cochleariae]|uniref:C2H2-type domain-containing protein n=1 Tax=Phaedon cochleariae TaxID=80249 RepID=A0A9P0GJZ9_PHACE|nr:unnamed protein product [Phaedon cochleariae]
MTSENLDTTNYSGKCSDSEEDFAPLRCWECNVNFTSKHYLYAHLFHHIRQPSVVLERVSLPPLKITLKNRSGNSFEIVSPPPSESPLITTPEVSNPANNTSNLAEIKQEEEAAQEEQPASSPLAQETDEGGEETNGGREVGAGSEDQILFPPAFTNVEEFGSNQVPGSPSSDAGTSTSTDRPTDTATDGLIHSHPNSDSNSNASEYGGVPGAEPTPPPEPTIDYPKIRIKTTGLLKEQTSLTITEITDDNPDGDPGFRDFFSDRSSDNSNLWPTPSLEDPLKLPDGDDNILSLFNNNDRAKDLGFHSSDNEFISLDRLEERNRGTMQLYNPSSQNSSGNPLDSLTGLPMQALAQQVSRLQPTANGMHQQNVLINIQQFPSGPPQPTYQPPPMYSYPQPMHQPYQYQPSYRPPNPMYYPPAPGYPPQHMPPPPQPQLGPPMNQQMGQPPMGGQQPMAQNQGPPTSQPQGMGQPMQQQGQPYRQPMPPRQMAPRQQQPVNRMPNGPRQPMGQRQPLTRPRQPMTRPRGGGGAGMTALRAARPRLHGPPVNGVRPGHQMAQGKRTPEQQAQLQAKKKRFDDMLAPDKDDDDCQVICMQPKNMDGGLPQIESVQSVQGGTAESSIMHLSDSITLSVRNPPPKRVESPKKSDAKAVANILATRGITVTATAKAKEKAESSQKNTPSLPASLNLNGAVSIIPAAKNNGAPNKSSNEEALPTVDLTDDLSAAQSLSSPQKQRPGLPYRCDLCPAQYPNAMGLNKHRQTYHKTSGGMAELGIPLVNLKTPGMLQKLSAMGIHNYIPIPSSGPEGTFCVPIINARNPGNVGSLGATTMLSLGPIRSIPKPSPNSMMNAAKQPNMQK